MQAPAAKHAAVAIPPRILLVGDTAQRRQVAEALDGRYRLDVAPNVAAALAAARAAPPDLLLTDLGDAPDELDLRRELRSSSCTRRVPILVLSSQSPAGERTEADESAADDCLVKPFTARELRMAVAAQIELSKLRDAAESALNQVEQRYRAIVEAQSEMVCRFRPDGLILFVNGAYARALGTTPDALIGKTFWEFVSPLDRETVRTLLDRLRPDTPEAHIENRFEAAEGVRWTLWTNRGLVFDDRGRATEVQSAGIDITDRKRAEETLRESEERFRTLADNISHFAWMADPTGHLFWYNRRWYDYTGTTPEDVRGWGWTKVHHPDHVERVVERIQHSWDTGEEWEDTFPLRAKDGTYRWFLSRALPIRDEEGRILRWFGTNTDVTEQRAAEEALREADRRKDEFLATLAHELRNPLAPLRNGLEIMRLAGDDRASSEQARHMMERQLGQMVRLIDDLLDLSRISRGKITLQKRRVELENVIQQAVGTSRPLIDEAGHVLTVTVPPGPIFVDGDPTRLAQVFSNLLNNAAKFTEPGGNIRLTVEAEAEAVRVRIADDGIGIPTDMLTRVFEMFAQVDRSLERAHAGLGIGLSLVQGLVEMHGGSVTARSDGPGKGSEFVVSLSAAASDALPVRHQQMRPGAAAVRCRVLVADDNHDAAESLAMLLDLMGGETRTVHDGAAAIETATTFRPDVALVDIGMPRVNGYDVARHIRHQPWGRNSLLVALTGWGQDEDRRRSREAGFDVHLVKPVEPDALAKLLESFRGA